MMTSCANEEAIFSTNESGNTVHMVVTASREGDGNTLSRTSFKEKDGSLECRWTAGDRLLVTDEEGVRKGVLTLTEGAGEAFGTFEGNLRGINDGNTKLNYFYLGTVPSTDGENGYASVESEKPYVKDFSDQPGTLESFVQNDILSVTKDVVVVDGNSYVENINLSRRVSYARFALNFPSEVSYPIDVTLSGTELANVVTLDIATNEVSYQKGNVKATVQSGKDLYITYLPTSSLYDITFSAVDKDGKKFTGKFSVEYVIPQGVYYRKTLKNDADEIIGYGGLPVDLTEYDIIFKEDPEGETDYDYEEDLTDPSNVVLPGDPKPGDNKEFLGWKKEGSDDEPTMGPWDLTDPTKGPQVTLVPVYKYTWNVTWTNGYDNSNDISKPYEGLVGPNISNDYPADFTRTGYKPMGWDKYITNLSTKELNVVITAQWEKLWDVKWVDADGTKIKQAYYDTTPENIDADEYPGVPEAATGYEFDKWEITKDVTNKTAVIKPIYKEIAVPNTVTTPGYEHGTFN